MTRPPVALCGSCGKTCAGSGDMLCVECLRFLPEWCRRLYMAAWRSVQGNLVGAERELSVRQRCIAAVVQARKEFPLGAPRLEVVVVARGKTRPAVLAFVADHPGSTLREITQGAGTAYKPTSVLLALFRREGKMIVSGGRPFRYSVTTQ